MKNTAIIVLIILILVLFAGCENISKTWENNCKRQCNNAQLDPRVTPLPECSCLTPTPTPPQASVQISGQIARWNVDVTNLGSTTTSFSVTIDYMDKDAILASETKNTPVIAPGEKGRITFFGDGVGAYSIKVKSIALKNGGNIEFINANQ